MLLFNSLPLSCGLRDPYITGAEHRVCEIEKDTVTEGGMK